MAETLGLQGLLVPEEMGGLGLGVQELAVVCDELGRALYNGPFLASSVMATSLLACGGEGAREMIAEFASGRSIGAVASQLRPVEEVPSFRVASATDGATELSGEETFVIGGVEAGVLLVPAQTERGVAIFAVDPRSIGVRTDALDSVDLLRPIASVELDRAPGVLLIDETESANALATARLHVTIALAAESVGAAARALEMTVEYVGQRVQFGRVIGSFQAVKHRCADMLVQLEGARSALFAALNAEDGSRGEQQRLASLAKVAATDAFFYVASETVHLHGGMGFTWDQPAHLFYRRAKANQLLLGRRDEHRRAIFHSIASIYQPEGITT